MAQIEQSDGGKKKKGAQKKMHIHVDFTPMVDMNMLLITFFMLCTTMLKPQTLKVALPAPKDENASDQQKGDQAYDEELVTMILDTKVDENGNPVYDAEGNLIPVIYYYTGSVESIDTIDGKLQFTDVNKNILEGNPIHRMDFIGNNKEGIRQGVRAALYEKNKQVNDLIEEQKDAWRTGKITKEEFEAAASKIKRDSTLFHPKVNIIPAEDASFQSFVGALDEMQLNNINLYRIAEYGEKERTLVEDFLKNNPE